MDIENLVRMHNGFINSARTSPGQRHDSATILALISMLVERDKTNAQLTTELMKLTAEKESWGNEYNAVMIMKEQLMQARANASALQTQVEKLTARLADCQAERERKRDIIIQHGLKALKCAKNKDADGELFHEENMRNALAALEGDKG